MFSFSRPNKRPVGFMTCLKSWLCVDISRYDTSHIHSETVDTTNWINKFPQTLNRNWSSFVHRLLWLHQNQTEDLLVARNEIVSSYYFFSNGFCTANFSETIQPISVKFSELIDNYKNLIYFFLFLWRHFRFWEIANFLDFRGSPCPDFFSITVRDRKLKFSAFVDKI